MIRSEWGKFVERARLRIQKGIKWSRERDPIAQVAEEIVAGQEGPAFLAAARKGRPGRVGLRVLIVREVERLIQVKKRKPRRKSDLDQTTEMFPT